MGERLQRLAFYRHDEPFCGPTTKDFLCRKHDTPLLALQKASQACEHIVALVKEWSEQEQDRTVHGNAIRTLVNAQVALCRCTLGSSGAEDSPAGAIARGRLERAPREESGP